MKMFSSYTTGGQYEATGYGYGPGIGEGYDKLVADCIQGLRRACDYRGNGIRGQPDCRRLEGGCRRGICGCQKGRIGHPVSQEPGKAEEAEEVACPPKEVVTAAIPGIEVMDLDDAVMTLWKEGIYAESGMGCTGPIVQISRPTWKKQQVY